MRHASLIALFGSCAVVVGTTLALPEAPLAARGHGQPAPRIVDGRSGHRELCAVAKLAAAEALEGLDFESYRGWQDRIRASCLAAVAP